MTSPNKAVGIWLLIISLLIFFMIAIGGYTRLSNSGLSMTSWKPITGWFPPLSHSAWEIEFSKYQNSPEFQKINYNMKLDGFKSIYYVEYFHRLFGRLLGFAYFIPFFIFWKMRKLNSKVLKYFLIGCLGGLQGLVGWFMVKSGLIDNPHVSAYRLCLHLGLATILLMLCYSNGLKELCITKKEENIQSNSQLFLKILIGLIFIQILSGAFVSGNLAGNTFMALFSANLASLWLPELGLLNLFENNLTILMIHVILASTITVLTIIHLIIWTLNKETLARVLLGTPLILQLSLGLLTAINYSPARPIALSLMHQLGAFILLITAMTALHKLTINNNREIT